jgi:hypothetical protein
MRSTDRVTGSLVRVAELFAALVLGALMMMFLSTRVSFHDRANAAPTSAWIGRPFYLTKNKA